MDYESTSREYPGAKSEPFRQFLEAGMDDGPETAQCHRLIVMPSRQANNPLHGITLEAIVTELVQRVGWEAMAQHVDVRCFKFDPSIKSSLQFLRRTPWARAKVEQLYLQTVEGDSHS